MSPISWRILHVCFCYFYSVAILYNFILFILYFYTVCTTKIRFFFGGSGISALFYWYLRFRPAILNVCVMLQMLLLVYNCWLFSLLLSLQKSSTTQKMNARVSSQICQMDCKMSTKIRWNKKREMLTLWCTHITR